MKRITNKLTSAVLSVIMALSVFVVPFTAAAACDHNYVSSVTKLATDGVDGTIKKVCSKCGDTATETMKAKIDSVDFTPNGNFEYGNTRSGVGATLEDTPASDKSYDFIKDFGGIANDPSAAEHNSWAFKQKWWELTQDGDNKNVEIHVFFPEGVFYFSQSFALDYWDNDAYDAWGIFFFDGVKDKTTLVVDDTTTTDKGFFTNPVYDWTGAHTNPLEDYNWQLGYTRQFATFNGTLQDITFMPKSYYETGKISSLNFIDGGTNVTTEANKNNNIALRLYGFKMYNCTVKGFNSLFVSCSSLTAPYLSNNTFEDFADAAFVASSFVDPKITNNIFKAAGYKTESGYVPSVFIASSNNLATSLCAAIISNNKLYNMQFWGESHSMGSRKNSTGSGNDISLFTNNECERVYGIKGIESVTLNKFNDCSKEDMRKYLSSLGEVSSSFENSDFFVIESSQTTNSYSSNDMTGTYLVSPEAREVIENEYKFKNVQIDYLTKHTTSDSESYTNKNIDFSMFQLQYVPANYFYNGTTLNLNGKAVYIGYVESSNFQRNYFGMTSLFDADGNEVGYHEESLPSLSEWQKAATGGVSVSFLDDGSAKLKITSNLKEAEVLTRLFENYNVNTVYSVSYSDDLQVIKGDLTDAFAWVSSRSNENGQFIGGTNITLLSNLKDRNIFSPKNHFGVEIANQDLRDGRISIKISCNASASNPVEIIIPNISLKVYDGFATGADLEEVKKTDMAVDYSSSGADYDEVFASIAKATGYGETNKIEKVYFDEVYGHLKTTSNGENDYTTALQTALDDIKANGKELILKDGEYNVTGSLALQGGCTYRIRGLGKVLLTNSAAPSLFTQKGTGDVSGYIVNVSTTPYAYAYAKPASSELNIFSNMRLKNFIIDKSYLGGAYSVFNNCKLDTFIFQGGYLSKATRTFNGSYVTNSLITDCYCHVGWVDSENPADEGKTDAGTLFYNTGFVNSTYRNVWSEFMRFANTEWYENNDYPKTNSLISGSLLDYTTEIRLGYGDIAIGNANYHASTQNLRWNDKGITNPGYDMETRSVGTYHISSGSTVIGCNYTDNTEISPTIYFEGETTKRSSNGKIAFKDITIFGNVYTDEAKEANFVFSYEGKLALITPRLDVDLDTCAYRNIDTKNSTGNYIDFSSVAFYSNGDKLTAGSLYDDPEWLIPGMKVYDCNVSGFTAYDSSATNNIGIVSPSGKKIDAKMLSTDMITYSSGKAEWNKEYRNAPEVIVKDGDYELRYGIDYIIVGQGRSFGSKANTKIFGIGKYTGVLAIPSTVTTHNITDCNVSLAYNSTTYTGSQLTPAVTKVNYRDTVLEEGTDYTVSYGENINGVGTVFITSTGNENSKFSGKTVAYFNINGGGTHNFIASVTPATCTTDGYTTYTCTDDGCEQSYKADYVPAKGHQTEKVTKTAATCKMDGIANIVCTICNQVIETEAIKTSGHKYRNVYVEPTCTTDGYIAKKCAVCGSLSEKKVKKATGHINTHTEVIDGTCSTPQITNTICNDCGAITATKEGSKNADNHSYEGTVQTPVTCTTDGLMVDATCKLCGATAAEITLPATGHNVEKWTEDDGVRSGICLNCGKTVRESLYTWDFTSETKGEYDFNDIISRSTFRSTGANNSAGVGDYGAYNYTWSKENKRLAYSATTANIVQMPAAALILETPAGESPTHFELSADTAGAAVPGVVLAESSKTILGINLIPSSSSLCVYTKAKNGTDKFNPSSPTERKYLKDFIPDETGTVTYAIDVINDNTFKITVTTYDIFEKVSQVKTAIISGGKYDSADLSCGKTDKFTPVFGVFNCDLTGFKVGTPYTVSTIKAAYSTDEEFSPELGDADGNGTVDMNDAVRVARADVGLVTITGKCATAADVNGDSKITVADALLITRKYLGIIKEFPIKK